VRPLRLSLTAFGPFLENQVVDLRGFRYSRLFLIHGPVGSGKTFLLDGICFALYGRSSGGERDRQGMRNLSAPSTTETSVVLDFEVASENYRIERRLVPVPAGPEAQRAFGPDEVVLWRLPAFGDPTRRDVLSSSLSGVEGMLTRLLGLSAEQFCQVAILPQGQFRRFLLAPVEERTAIIGRMFDGHVFQRFAAILADEHAGLKQQLAQAWKEREEVTSRYKDTLGDPRERLWRSQEELAAVTTACQSHQHKSQEWERSLETAVRYETLERQKEMSQRELDELTHQGENPADALTRRLKEALPEFQRWREATAEIEEIAKELDDQRSQYDKLKRETNFLEAEVEQARRQEEEKYALFRAQERLEEVSQEAAGLTMLDGEVRAAQGRLGELARTRAVLAQDVKRAQARALKLESELERMGKAELRLAGLRHEVAGLESRDQEVRQKGQIVATVEQARQREIRLRDALDVLQTELVSAQDRWYSQRAQSRAEALYRLKDELKSGKECPLCGAKRHPRPFDGSSEGEAVDDELEQRITALKARREHALQELAQAEERRARFEGRLEGMARVATDSEDVSELVDGLRSSIAMIESKLAQRQTCKEELRRLERELLPNRKKLRQMRLMKERLEATIESAQGMRGSRRERLAELLTQSLGLSALGDDDSWVQLLEVEKGRIAERLAELEASGYSTERAELMAETFALGLAETRAAEKRRDSLQRQADEQQQSLLDSFRLDFANWPDLQFALGRQAREFRLARGQDSVVDRETLVRAVQRQIDQTEELLSGVPQPPMRSEAIRHALGHEREQIELKIGRRVSLQRSVEQGAKDVETYDAVVEKIRDLEARMAAIGPLAAEVSGDNKAGIAFADWVLERCFAQVLSAANNKLETLAPQRFALLQERGLEVKIFDLQAGVARSATTLSGGESFLASLALALGLGEVLQGAEKAAERLGTLFIDEGFGYLDQQALDAALQCLEGLRGEGRTIGLVSHVADLRERIRAQIIVAGRDDAGAAGRVQVFSV
jgi:exonuclease SbcC